MGFNSGFKGLRLYYDARSANHQESSPVPYYTNKNTKMYRCHISVLLGAEPAVSFRLLLLQCSEYDKYSPFIGWYAAAVSFGKVNIIRTFSFANWSNSGGWSVKHFHLKLDLLHELYCHRRYTWCAYLLPCHIVRFVTRAVLSQKRHLVCLPSPVPNRQISFMSLVWARNGWLVGLSFIQSNLFIQ